MSTPNDGTRTIDVTLSRRGGYAFEATTGGQTEVRFTVDEDPPLGTGLGPTPVALLAAAVGDCLSSSLLFCLAKAHVVVGGMSTKATATLERNEHGRLRIVGIKVSIRPELAGGERAKSARCEALFEDFCTVTQSVRDGIDVEVDVDPAYLPAATPAIT